ncbi:MAG TPA: response regulator [Chitinophagaceae bacterium]|jgi:two-component system response regulator|nr:response regulator [Chitinophagaceae bacterium]
MNNNEIEIVLVEDNMDDAEMTIRALKKVNLANKLIHLEDGQEALDFLFAQGKFFGRELTNKPKVILLDIKMPKVDGIEVLRKIKSAESTRSIPVVIMTSSAEDNDIITSYDLGVNSYIVKPVHFENFAKAVSELGLYWLLTNRTPKEAGKL